MSTYLSVKSPSNRKKGILRDSYRATLDEVSDFVDEAKTGW